jgi:hypothetical protein
MRCRAASDRLLVRFVRNQTTRLAAHQADTRAGQAAHSDIGSLVLNIRRVIIKDVLNIQAGCRASEDEWAYHCRSQSFAGGAAVQRLQ